MTIFFILFLGGIGILGGRYAFHRWFNHVSLYSGIWSFSLSLFEARLINYYPLETETWLIIVGGWMAFVCGSLTIVFAKWSVGFSSSKNEDNKPVQSYFSYLREKIVLERVLWILNIVTLLAAIHTWYLLVQLFGSVSNVLARGALLYSLSVSQEIKGTIPYLSSLCLTATLLAGVYTAKVGKLKLVSILPLIICIIVNFSNMGRALMIMASVIFSSGYFMVKKEEIFNNEIKRPSRMKQILMGVFFLSLLILASELVRSTRHIDENVSGAKRSLKSLQGASFITPTIYLYLTVHHGVLNQYIKQEAVEGFFGANTFAPLLRVLDKFGFDTYVEQKQIGYLTPSWANTGTYLRELHSDFGIAGVLLIPYIIGCLTSYFWFRFKESQRYVHLAILTYFQVLTVMGLFYLVTLAGYLLVYLIGALLIGYMMDRYLKKVSIGNQ